MKSQKKINSTIDIKQGYLFSPTLFVLCVAELEQMVAKIVNKEGIEEVAIGNVAIIAFVLCRKSVGFGKYFRRCTKAYEDIGKNLHAY
mgnify:CR=1 FL=1